MTQQNPLSRLTIEERLALQGILLQALARVVANPPVVVRRAELPSAFLTQVQSEIETSSQYQRLSSVQQDALDILFQSFSQSVYSNLFS